MNLTDVPQPADAAARQAVDRLYDADTAARHLGMQLIDAGVGRAVVTMQVMPTMVNGHGICHGGLIFALADTAFAYACNAAGGSHVATAASIDFLRAVHTGEILRAEAVEAWKAGRNGLTDVRVYGTSDELVAIFHGRSRRIDRI